MSQPQSFYDTAVKGAFSTTYTYIPFGFYARSMIMIVPKNTNTDDLFYSWDGQNIHGRVSLSELALNLSGAVRNGIYIKTNSGSQGAEITAY